MGAINDDSGISSGDESKERDVLMSEIINEANGHDEEFEKRPNSTAERSEKQHYGRRDSKLRFQPKFAKNHGRIMVSIRNYAPPVSKLILESESFQIAGLRWCLQLVFNRNNWTGRTRFLSVFVQCENLPPNESLHALIIFRLVSQLEGKAGYQQEIIGHFDANHRHAGISNFFDFRQIFSNENEYICEQLGNEAQIEAIIRVKSRRRVQISTIKRLLLSAPIRLPAETYANFCSSSPIDYVDNCRRLISTTPIAHKNINGKQEEANQQAGKPEKELIEEKEQIGEGEEEHLAKTGGPISIYEMNDQYMANFDEEVENNGSADEQMVDEEEEWVTIEGDFPEKIANDEKWEEGRNKEEDEEYPGIVGQGKKTHRAIGGSEKITQFFSLRRRSCRIVPKCLDSIRLQMLKQQVNAAAHEPWLEIFSSPTKGKGLRAKKKFAKDSFVVEYKGEILNLRRAKKREKEYAQNPEIGCYMFYFKHNETQWCIDATTEELGKGRFVNHSRLAPNMKAKVFDLGDQYPHLCLVSLREIHEDEELTFDYGDRTPLIVSNHPWLLNS